MEPSCRNPSMVRRDMYDLIRTNAPMKSAIVLESGNLFNGEFAKRSQQTINASSKIKADTFPRNTTCAKCIKKRRPRRICNPTTAKLE